MQCHHVANALLTRGPQEARVSRRSVGRGDTKEGAWARYAGTWLYIMSHAQDGPGWLLTPFQKVGCLKVKKVAASQTGYRAAVIYRTAKFVIFVLMSTMSESFDASHGVSGERKPPPGFPLGRSSLASTVYKYAKSGSSLLEQRTAAHFSKSLGAEEPAQAQL